MMGEKNDKHFRELGASNMKSNICVIGIPEGKGK